MSREDNRKAMPTVAFFVSEFKAAFGDVKVTYASENGKELGKRDEEPGLSVADMVIHITPKGKRK